MASAYPSESLTRFHIFKVEVQPLRYQRDTVSNPGADIATVMAGFWGVIPFFGDAIAILGVLIGGLVHLVKGRKQKRVDQAVHTDPTRPWQWQVLVRGPDPDGPYRQVWVSGSWVAALGLRPTATGAAWVKGIEPTRELALAKAECARAFLAAQLR